MSNYRWDFECYSVIVGLLPIHVSNGLFRWDVYPFTRLSCFLCLYHFSRRHITARGFFVSLFLFSEIIFPALFFADCLRWWMNLLDSSISLGCV